MFHVKHWSDMGLFFASPGDTAGGSSIPSGRRAARMRPRICPPRQRVGGVCCRTGSGNRRGHPGGGARSPDCQLWLTPSAPRPGRKRTDEAVPTEQTRPTPLRSREYRGKPERSDRSPRRWRSWRHRPRRVGRPHRRTAGRAVRQGRCARSNPRLPPAPGRGPAGGTAIPATARWIAVSGITSPACSASARAHRLPRCRGA